MLVLAVVALAPVVALSACGGDTDGGPPAVTVTASITGQLATATTTAGTATLGATGTPTARRPTPTRTPGRAATATRPPSSGAQPTQPRATARPQPTRTPRPPATETPASFGIAITSPREGATVPPTFTVRIAVTGIELNLGPNGELIPGDGHWHIAVDTAPPLPQAHDTPTAQIGPLAPGPHTITALLNLNDADLTVVAIAQVRVVVAQ